MTGFLFWFTFEQLKSEKILKKNPKGPYSSPPTPQPRLSPSVACAPPQAPTSRQHPPSTLAVFHLSRVDTRVRNRPRILHPRPLTHFCIFLARISALPTQRHRYCVSRRAPISLAGARRNATRRCGRRYSRSGCRAPIVEGPAGSANGEDEGRGDRVGRRARGEDEWSGCYGGCGGSVVYIGCRRWAEVSFRNERSYNDVWSWNLKN